MGFLRRFAGGNPRQPEWMIPEGEYREVAGVIHHLAEFGHVFERVDEALIEDMSAMLVRDPRNEYDSNAVEVRIRGALAGYPPHEIAAAWSARLAEAEARGMAVRRGPTSGIGGLTTRRRDTISCTDMVNAPPVGGTYTATWNLDWWGRARLENAGGAWEGSVTGVYSTDRGDAIATWFQGTGARTPGAPASSCSRVRPRGRSRVGSSRASPQRRRWSRPGPPRTGSAPGAPPWVAGMGRAPGVRWR